MVPTPAVNTRSNRHPYAIPVSTPYPPSVRWNNRKPQLQSAKNTHSQNNEYVTLSKRPVSCPPRELPPRPARRPQTGRQAIQPAYALWRMVFLAVLDADPTMKDRPRIQESRGTPIRLGVTPAAQPGALIKRSLNDPLKESQGQINPKTNNRSPDPRMPCGAWSFWPSSTPIQP